MKLEKIQQRRSEIRQAINKLQFEDDDLRDAENKKKYEDFPTEDGWYLDDAGQIARLDDGVWHDGWGNPDEGWLTPPMRRLVEEPNA